MRQFAGHFSPTEDQPVLLVAKDESGCSSGMRIMCCLLAYTQGQQRRPQPPLQRIPVREPFECFGMNFEELESVTVVTSMH